MEIELLVVGILLSISEILGQFEMFKSNNIFQLIVGFLNKLKA